MESKRTLSQKKHTISELMKHTKGYHKDITFAWVFVFCESLLEIGIAALLSFLLKAIQGTESNNFQPDLSKIIMWACIIMGMAVLAAIMGILAGYWASSAACGFGKNLRDAMFVKIQDYSFKNIDKFSPASIVTRTTTDVTNVQFSFMMIVRTVIRAPFLMIFSLVMSFIFAPKLAWIFLIIIPVLLFLLLFISAKVHPTFVKIFDTYDGLNESVEEDVDGIRVVKSFGRKEFHVSHFNSVSDDIYKNYIHAEKILACNSPLMNTAIFSAMILLSVLGAFLITKTNSTELDVSSLSSLFTYVMMILSSLMMISMVYVMITISRNSAERIIEIINEEPDIKSPENPISEVKTGDVEFSHVDFGYNDKALVLKDVNLKFSQGQMVGIIGPTGSSKTSLVSLIARLFDTTSGTVKVGDVDVKEYDLKVLRDSVAVVLQKNVLFTGTIRDNLKWGNENATDEEIWKACDLAQASEFLHSFPEGLDTMLVEGGTNVSGGQKQRLCIARALLKNPKILILDDSTSACDTHTDAMIRSGLASTRPDVTKFIIAQRVLSIKDCDVIIVMDNGGKIVAVGSNDELMQNCDVYKELYESQLGGGDFDVNE